MKQNHLLSLLQKDFVTIHVAFRSDIDAATNQPTQVAFDTSRKPRTDIKPRTYTYKAPITDGIKADDFVVVDHPKGGPMVAMVYGVDTFADINPDADFEYKWIVCKVDRTAYEARQAREKEFLASMQHVEREAQRAELIEKFAKHLPEGSEARAKYNAAVASVNQPLQLDDKKPV